MNLTKNFHQIIRKISDPDKPYLIIITLIFMALVLLITQDHLINKKEVFTNQTEDINPNKNIDTFVPDGYVLVTLQLTNGEAIDPIIGQFGLVDLYQFAQENSSSFYNNDEIGNNDKLNQYKINKSYAIATHIRIVRAPNNQKLFGALIPENSKKLIQLLAFPVFAVVQRPNAQSSEPLKLKSELKPNKRKIEYGDIL